MNELLNRYLNEISCCILLSRRHKKQLLARIRPELEDQLDNATVSDYGELVALLGPPEQMAEELSGGEPYSTRIASAKKARRKTKTITTIAVIAILAIALLCVHLALMQPGYYEATLT